MDCSPSGSSIYGDSPGENTGVGCYSFLQGIFLIQIYPMSPELQAGRFFTIWDTREEMEKIFLWVIKNSIDLYLWFFCRIFIVSGLVFGSLKHFEFIFVYGVRKCSNFILLHIFGGDLFTQSCPTLVIPWTVAHQAPLSMRFSRQEYWSGLSFPFPGDLPKHWIEPGCPAWQANSLPTELPFGCCIACIYPLLTAWLTEETVFFPLYVLSSILTN